MRSYQIPFLALLTGVASIPHEGLTERDESQSFCGFKVPTDNDAATISRLKEFDSDYAFSSNQGILEVAEPIVVEMNIHASLPTDSPDDYASEEVLEKQFDVLKTTFAPYGIELTLGTISRELNDSISNLSGGKYAGNYGQLSGGPPALEDYWKRTRTGGYKSAHLYVYHQIDDGFIGISSFPELERPESDFWLDSVHLLALTLPGSTSTIWNQGKAAIHEFGHWFGLWHVFRNGCLPGDGDMVDDTPAQVDNHYGECPTDADSCPSLEGLDTPWNYMSYGGDACFTGFTDGQVTRVHNMFHNIREVV
ncbi:unnamed protein product [Clonostachys byssicola]|uniref:Peptidase M43 pregnancy-associated plasma-A domain-containing protein n=1 Tax=Clonostachys byssicola TaxID=160290 RepID=A0A9N9UE07_9HYPO|nr:unnamed protein product [Clonostachys byssicola]